MGGFGSGRHPKGSGKKPRARTATADAPVDDGVVEALYDGLERGLLVGDPKASIELCLRLDHALLRRQITPDDHSRLGRMAQTRHQVANHVAAERRTKRLEGVARTMERRRKPGQHLRSVGPPPDCLADPPPDPPGSKEEP